VSFGLRQTLVTALAVAVAVAAASAVVYVLIRNEQRGQVEEARRERAEFLTGRPLAVASDPETGELVLRVPGPPGPRLEPGGVFVQAVREDGNIASPDPSQAEFPVSEDTLEAARGERSEFFSDATVAGSHVRMLTVPLEQGFALQLVRPLDEIDQLLDRVGLVMILVAVVGIGVAAVLGALVARTALKPVRKLTTEAELVTETQDLGHRIELHGHDELARLGATFNTMLAALEESQRAQRQLVSDASHELRTPLTSLRTNIEVLARRADLPDEKREALLRDLVGQLEEISLLVTNLVELSSERPPELEAIETQLDVLTQEAVDRAKRLSPQVTFHTDLHESVVSAVPSRLERAIANLLDNAVKWSPPGAAVDVGVNGGEVTVRDRGPGIDDADVSFVFDRFYRAPAARALPGFGLGLALVRQVAEEHGGTVAVERPEGGGTLVRLRVPENEVSEDNGSG
jgi:two-component system, OmpR family, sensor histidine kinase MprB